MSQQWITYDNLHYFVTKQLCILIILLFAVGTNKGNAEPEISHRKMSLMNTATNMFGMESSLKEKQFHTGRVSRGLKPTRHRDKRESPHGNSGRLDGYLQSSSRTTDDVQNLGALLPNGGQANPISLLGLAPQEALGQDELLRLASNNNVTELGTIGPYSDIGDYPGSNETDYSNTYGEGDYPIDVLGEATGTGRLGGGRVGFGGLGPVGEGVNEGRNIFNFPRPTVLSTTPGLEMIPSFLIGNSTSTSYVISSASTRKDFFDVTTDRDLTTSQTSYGSKPSSTMPSSTMTSSTLTSTTMAVTTSVSTRKDQNTTSRVSMLHFNITSSASTNSFNITSSPEQMNSDNTTLFLAIFIPISALLVVAVVIAVVIMKLGCKSKLKRRSRVDVISIENGSTAPSSRDPATGSSTRNSTTSLSDGRRNGSMEAWSAPSEMRSNSPL